MNRTDSGALLTFHLVSYSAHTFSLCNTLLFWLYSWLLSFLLSPQPTLLYYILYVFAACGKYIYKGCVHERMYCRCLQLHLWKFSCYLGCWVDDHKTTGCYMALSCKVVSVNSVFLHGDFTQQKRKIRLIWPSYIFIHWTIPLSASKAQKKVPAATTKHLRPYSLFMSALSTWMHKQS